MQNINFINIEYVFYKIYSFFVNFQTVNLRPIVEEYWLTVIVYSFVISSFLIFWIVYYVLKIKEVEKLDEEIYGTIFVPKKGEDSSLKNERWAKVLQHLEVESQAEWRAAIIEADIVLDEMTKKMGYHGDTLGERLKGVEKSDFNTLDLAWEAHKVRNTIAHQGSDYILTRREVKRVVNMYRMVFEEFHFI